MTEKNMWNLSPEEALKACQTSEQGLTTEQAEKIRLEAGENMLKEGKKKSPFQVFLDQFKDLMVVILIGAAIISMFSGNEESTIVIFAVLVMNAVLGTVQHMKAEKSLESLKQLSAPDAKVIRDGRKQEIPAKDVVPGDILELEAGDMVAADGRILHNYSLQVNESSLTGESTNVDKQEMALNGEAALADRTNMVYSGSLVTYGRATVLVTATGMNTEIGKIAGLMNGAEERKTPLQKSLDQFSGKLAVLIMVVCALVFALCMFRKMSLLDALLFAVALAVAAIPEALTSIVTIVQAFGTQKMAKENAIIKKLKAVESLGCVSVICSDKTGTLTQNSLRAEAVCINGKVMDTGQLKKYSHHPDLSLFLRSVILANNASGEEIGEKEDPLEQALLHMAEEAGKDPGLLRRQWRRISEIPFNSDKKYMGAICSKGGEKILFVKGAVDVLLSKCSLAVNPSFQEEETASWGRPFSFSDKERILRQNGLWSKKGMRVLALGCKPLKEEEIRDALAEMGKFSPKDELNCGACGYNTCREKAIAIIQNKAEVAMCIPYMRAKQESYSNKVFNAMPGLLVTVDYNLKIIQMNEAASKLFNMPKKRRLIGKPVSEIMDDYSLASILAFERNLMQDEIYLEDQKCYLDRVMTNDKENKMILCIMKDITKERKHKDQIHNAQIEAARMADKLVEEQLKIVQQIAGLLGETAADTKVAVEKLKNTILLESEEENEKK